MAPPPPLPPRKPSRTQICLVTLVIGMMAASLLACNLAWATQVWLPRPRQVVSRTVSVCASLRPSLDFRAAVWWQRRYVGKSGRPLKAHIQSNVACAFVPWAASWDDDGVIETSE